jgi:hypothetical protein
MVLLFIFVGVLLGQPLATAADELSAQLQDTRDAARRSARYLASRVRKDGRFEYRINLDPSLPATDRYNVLRHAGAIYALGMYHRMAPDPQVGAAMERAGSYLRDETIASLPTRDDLLAVWSKPDITQSGKPLQAKLGGTGLGLVGLLSVEDMKPGFTTTRMRRGLGQFIVYMQQPDGGYFSKFIPSRGGRQDDWHSLYYPGEATLGLLMLYEFDRSRLWLESASKALAYLAQKRLGRKIFPADHWTLLATQKFFSLGEAKQVSVSRDLLLEHARRICEAILSEQVTANDTRYDGAFSEDGRTTPAATRLEGMLAALTFLPPDDDLIGRIEPAVHRGIAFLLRAQVKEGKFAGAIPRAIGRLPSNEPDAITFNRRATEVRIDYVQHALSAMTQYLALNQKQSTR